MIQLMTHVYMVVSTCATAAEYDTLEQVCAFLQISSKTTESMNSIQQPMNSDYE